MGFLFGVAVGYTICKYQAPIVAWVKSKFDNDDGGPPAFVG